MSALTFRVVCYWLLVCLQACHVTAVVKKVKGSDQPVSLAASKFVPSIDVKAQCPHLRIAIVNGVQFHFEVLSGLLHVLRPYERNIGVCVSTNTRVLVPHPPLAPPVDTSACTAQEPMPWRTATCAYSHHAQSCMLTCARSPDVFPSRAERTRRL